MSHTTQSLCRTVAAELSDDLRHDVAAAAVDPAATPAEQQRAAVAHLAAAESALRRTLLTVAGAAAFEAQRNPAAALAKPFAAVAAHPPLRSAAAAPALQQQRRPLAAPAPPHTALLQQSTTGQHLLRRFADVEALAQDTPCAPPRPTGNPTAHRLRQGAEGFFCQAIAETAARCRVLDAAGAVRRHRLRVVGDCGGGVLTAEVPGVCRATFGLDAAKAQWRLGTIHWLLRLAPSAVGEAAVAGGGPIMAIPEDAAYIAAEVRSALATRHIAHGLRVLKACASGAVLQLLSELLPAAAPAGTAVATVPPDGERQAAVRVATGGRVVFLRMDAESGDIVIAVPDTTDPPTPLLPLLLLDAIGDSGTRLTLDPAAVLQVLGPRSN